MTMALKYFNGQLEATGTLEEEDISLKEAALKVIEDYKGMMKEFAFHKALITVWELIGRANKYVDTMKPWAMAKQRRERLGTVLNNITELIKIVSVLLWPFMPQTAEKIQHQLGLGVVGLELHLASLREWGGIRQVRPISKAPPLFPRVKRHREEGVKEEPNLVSLEDFQGLDLRVGIIKEAEPIPGSKKLLKLTVDIGEERSIVAGLANHYQLDELKDKQVIVLANLRPVRLMGVESRGMILAAEDETGVHILIPDKESKPGSIIT